MKLEDLEKIKSSPEFNRLPRDLAEVATKANDRWWHFHEHLVGYELEAVIWGACQHIISLFETYGSTVKEVKVNLGIETNQATVYYKSHC